MQGVRIKPFGVTGQKVIGNIITPDTHTVVLLTSEKDVFHVMGIDRREIFVVIGNLTANISVGRIAMLDWVERTAFFRITDALAVSRITQIQDVLSVCTLHAAALLDDILDEYVRSVVAG